jgi:hypothetical protein
MRDQVALTITSLLSILLSIFHLTHDIVHGMFPRGLAGLLAVVALTVWLYATMLLNQRRSGHVIILAFSLFASYLPIIHMKGSGGVTGGIKSGGAFFFAWTLLTLGVTAIFSAVLSARGLWSLRRA